MGFVIEPLTPEMIAQREDDLVDILVDAVNDGASVGFLAPLAPDEARAYWRSVRDAVADGARVLLVAAAPGQRAVGTVQLDLAMRANGLHRAEVVRLLVHTGARRHGLGRRLMLEIEARARALNRTTLVLDTRLGDPSEGLYRSLGWILTGVVPKYARSSSGALDGSAFYYKLLDPNTIPGSSA